METRCPNSPYLGVARLNNYRWIINDRGYANVVEIPDSERSQSTGKYDDVVYGLVYSLTPTDESRLDKNEGVPIAYTKEGIECDFWKGTTGGKVDTRKKPDETVEMLVYIDRHRTTPDKPRDEYVYRMNQGIADAVAMGVPEKYVEEVMRVYIPAKEGQGRKSMEEFAKGQAAAFKDESGVFQ